MKKDILREVSSQLLGELVKEVRDLHAVLDNVEAFIYTKDKDGRYTYANRKVRELFGLPLEQVLGRHEADFFDQKTAASIRVNDLRVLTSGEPVAAEETNSLADSGQTRIYLSQKSPLRNDDGEIVGLYGISTDITERKKLENELEANRSLLNSVLNNLDAFVYLKDPQLRFLYVNDKTAALFGKSAEEIVGHTNHEVLPAEVAEHFSATDRKVFAEGKKQVAEESSLGADGLVHHYWSHKIPLIRDGQIYAYIGFSTDISELHEIKEELHRQAITDSLTGLHNRRYFMDVLDQRRYRSLQMD